MKQLQYTDGSYSREVVEDIHEKTPSTIEELIEWLSSRFHPEYSYYEVDGDEYDDLCHKAASIRTLLLAAQKMHGSLKYCLGALDAEEGVNFSEEFAALNAWEGGCK